MADGQRNPRYAGYAAHIAASYIVRAAYIRQTLGALRNEHNQFARSASWQ